MTPVTWPFPSSYCFVINLDGAAIGTPAGTGFVIRNSPGQVIALSMQAHGNNLIRVCAPGLPSYRPQGWGRAERRWNQLDVRIGDASAGLLSEHEELQRQVSVQ
ncbi:unnamed protein product [Dovyalis caffra]|uniref:Uncharacterized protein n=1 Tax=Dovyalis caffra TaxID=77055 RepID=A0AAV1QNK8_9ROSI|nr:unnamed protein product [Dovyalis caffra]CAK7324380.1 unnamed protein product [Dovyalis caffra]